MNLPGTMPGFLCIGAQKAGTSWLFERLRTHPGIWTPPLKELHYFDHLHIPRNRRWTHAHLRRGVRRALCWHVNHAKTFDRDWMRYLCDLADRDPFTPGWYARAFARAPSGRLCMDVTPEYASLPEAGAAQVARDLPGVKILHILRAPAARALSQMRMNMQRRGQAGAAAWRAALEDPDLADRGDYAAQIPRWQAAIAPDRLMFLPFGRIARDPAAALTEVERFLGLDPGPRGDEVGRKVHATRPAAPPRDVRAELERRLAPQEAFLAATFGADFAAEC